MDKNIQYIVFADELEIDASASQQLTFYYFGIIVPVEKIILLEQEVQNAVAILDKIKYHARKQYKRPEYAQMLTELSKIIIENHLHIVCFPFVKEWLNDPTLAVLKELKYEEAPQISIKNYRSQAWLLFIHVLNYFFSMNYPSHCKVRVLVDHDWLQINQGVEHKGEKLTHLEAIIAVKTKDFPLLTLPDHAAYLFLQLRRNLHNNNSTVKLSPANELILNEAKALFEKNGLFSLLDLTQWIDYENSV